MPDPGAVAPPPAVRRRERGHVPGPPPRARPPRNRETDPAAPPKEPPSLSAPPYSSVSALRSVRGYHPSAMRGQRLPWKAVPAAALAGSQLGHLLVYALRLGPEGLAAAGSGAHAYLPSLATALAGAGAGGGLVARPPAAQTRSARTGSIDG